MSPGGLIRFSRVLDSPVPERVSSAAGSGSPHFQHLGGISATARRSADTKFCDEQAAQWRIIGAILPFPAQV